MAYDLLPLFPLAVVLLPQNELPLHIFEERYKEMIGAVLEAQSEFGIVLAVEGSISAIGCTASIEEILKRYPDGRLDIVTIGRRRFRIHSLDNHESYLRGQVEFFSDEETEAPLALRNRLVELARRMWPARRFDVSNPELSFLVAAEITDLEIRQQLLGSRSEADRVRRLLAFLPGYAERVAKITRTREVAPRNGHSHLPVDFDQSV